MIALRESWKPTSTRYAKPKDASAEERAGLLCFALEEAEQYSPTEGECYAG